MGLSRSVLGSIAQESPSWSLGTPDDWSHIVSISPFAKLYYSQSQRQDPDYGSLDMGKSK